MPVEDALPTPGPDRPVSATRTAPETSPTPTTTKGRGGLMATARRLAGPLRVLVALLILAAIVYAVVSQWGDVQKALETLAWQSVVLALVTVVGGTAAGLMSWRSLLAQEGHQLSVPTAGRIFFVGQLGKYLPGSVWSVVLQMELAHDAGVPRARTFTTSLAWVGLSISSALTVGLVGLPVIASSDNPLSWVLVGLLPIALVCTHPKVLTRLVDIALRLLRKPPLPTPFTWRGVGSAFGWLIVTWVLYGIHLWLLANALGAPGWDGFLRCLGGFALALTAGVLFVVAPSGAGVREGLIVAALAGVMSRGEALGLAVVSRMLFTVTDVLLAGVAALSAVAYMRRRRAAEESAVDSAVQSEEPSA